MERKKIIIIGNGMVSYKFCEKFATKSQNFDIQVFGEESRRAYDRVHLTEFFNGQSAEDLSLCKENWYSDNGIELYLGDPIIKIDRDRKMVYSAKGKQLSYDYLIMATGSAPFVPSIVGIDKEGVFVYRTIDDLEKIKAYALNARKGTVIGGGLLGLEAAKALIDLDLEETHVVEFAPRLMPRQIDEQASGILQNKLSDLGLQVLLNKETIKIEGEDSIHSLQFRDGSELRTEMLVISAGIRPRDELARDCGLEIGARGGVVVNKYMQTSDPDVFAIGECALFDDSIYGLVAPGYEMAEVAINKLIGTPKSFKSFDMSTKLKLIGVDVASFGDHFITEPDAS